jgi:L-ascorbate metabolism protein UlaG (beta-lactamase superfamily)
MITSASGVKIIVDPYTTSERTYSAINESADIVTVSHEHSDHNDTKAIKGDPEIIRGLVSKAVKGITFSGVASFHDNVQGTQRGANTIFLFAVDGIRFCHLGDLGHRLNSEKMAEIGPVDVLFIPVGGTFTIDAAMATTVAEDLKPKIVLPMHYRTPKSNPTVVPVDDFIKGKANVEQLTGSILELKKDTLPAQMRIIVLQHAR